MQYKTVQIEHFQGQKKSDSLLIGKKYEEVINREAMEGWKLLGIHSLPIVRRAGCLKMCMGVFVEKFTMDVLIFFKD